MTTVMTEVSPFDARAQLRNDSGRDPNPISETAFHIPSLDGLRAAAFLLVFFGHAVPVALSRFVPPAFGVSVFFVLSGYLITTLLRKEFDRSGTVSLRGFYQRRIFRILPLFYVVLLISTLLTQFGAIEGQVSFGALTAYVLHGANYWHIFRGLDDIPGGTSVYWSLSVEEHFYLLFPLLYLAMRRARLSAHKQLAVVLGLCALVLMWRVMLVTVLHASEERLYRATDTRVDSILFGCALAIYGNPALEVSRFSARTWRRVWLPLGAAVLLLTAVVRQPLFHQAIKGSLQAAALLPFFVVAIRCPAWGPIRLLNTRLMRFIGLLSYGLYLTHRTALMLAARWIPSNHALQVALGFALAMACCYALHVFVETPALQLRKRLGSLKAARPMRRAAEMPAPAQPSVVVG